MSKRMMLQPPHSTYLPLVGLLSQQSKCGFLCSGCIVATHDEVFGEGRTSMVQIQKDFPKPFKHTMIKNPN